MPGAVAEEVRRFKVLADRLLSLLTGENKQGTLSGLTGAAL